MANKDEEQDREELEDEESWDDDVDEEEDDGDEDYDEGEDDEFEDDDFGPDDDGEADPFWWTPHAVLALLLVIGVLGAFGFFNKALGFLAAVPAEHDDGHGDVATAEPAKKQAAKPKRGERLGPEKAKPPSGDVYGAKHLLVQYKGSKRAGAAITRTKEEAKKRAEEAAVKAAALAKANPKIADKSKKFSELVGEYSDEPGAARRGGDLGRFRKGSMVPQFQEAVEKLKRGDVSGVVETPFGYHVILRTF